ncbi:MAG: hypothetical protein PHV90_09130, partial [Smithella sp.]|nr:hypothetical protein [Smithella sp.]
ETGTSSTTSKRFAVFEAGELIILYPALFIYELFIVNLIYYLHDAKINYYSKTSYAVNQKSCSPK